MKHNYTKKFKIYFGVYYLQLKKTYGLTIHMNHTDQQSVWFLHYIFFPINNFFLQNN